MDTDVVSHGFARSRLAFLVARRLGSALAGRSLLADLLLALGPAMAMALDALLPSRPSDYRCSCSLPRRLMRGRHVRCCEQNECISIEQLYIKPTRVEQFIDEYTGRVAMASHPPFSLC